MTSKPISFTPFESFFDPGFWSKFYDNKLEVYKLDETGVPLLLSYSTSPHISLQPKLNAYGEYSFTPLYNLGSQSSASPCTLFNFNSFQSFKDSDKKAILTQQSDQLWKHMLDLHVLSKPSLLTPSFIISYADLKKYLYTHWFCVPSFQIPALSYTITNEPIAIKDYHTSYQPHNNLPSQPEKGKKDITLLEWAQIFDKIDNLTHNPLFLFEKTTHNIIPLLQLPQLIQRCLLTGQKHQSLAAFCAFFSSQYLFIYIDPVANPQTHSWSVRNYLLFIGLIFHALYPTPQNQDNNSQIDEKISFDILAVKNLRELQVSYQELLIASQNAHNASTHTSYVYSMAIGGLQNALPEAISYIRTHSIPKYFSTQLQAQSSQDSQDSQNGKDSFNAVNVSTDVAIPLLDLFNSFPSTPGTIGWERHKEKLQPKQSSSKNMDPLQIYSQAVDMNLKLLKWQHWAEMPLDAIRAQKCLLIGSGTLGCYVSRLLLGWGIKDITMLDYGKVSPSNPVRQPLFTYLDWQQGKHKAVAACEALKAIHPKANVTPIILSIPSAGTVSQKELPQALQSASKLAQLIKAHDAIFLLTDSRASRWLPTLLAQAYGKKTFASAIGPDTFVAMSHGIRQGWKYTDTNCSQNTTPLIVDNNEKYANLVKEQAANTNSASLSLNDSTMSLFQQSFDNELQSITGTTDSLNHTSFNSTRDTFSNISGIPRNQNELSPIAVENTGTLSCGCYFCPDQAAPILGIPQSIDQQCTVTRAEVAALASSYVVNLFIHSVSHTCTYTFDSLKKITSGDKTVEDDAEDDHNDKNEEKDENDEKNQSNNSLCVVPTSCKTCEENSQVRGGVLTAFSPVVESSSVSCPPSTTCIACGYSIIKAYQADPVGFLTATLTDAENVTLFSGFKAEFEGGEWENDEWDIDGDGCCDFDDSDDASDSANDKQSEPQNSDGDDEL